MPRERLSTQTSPSTEAPSEAVSLRIVPLTIPKENRVGINMYIHAYIFYRNSYTVYVRHMSEAQFENEEQKQKETGTFEGVS